MLRSAIVATQFLTRIQLSRRVVEGRELAGAVAYFPLIGALVGVAIAGVTMAVTPLVGLDAAIVAGLAFGAVLTGAMHEDGLADACDGLGGGATKTRALEIMHDSRIGSYGAVALILLYAARFTLFRALGAAGLLLALPVASALGRGSGVVLMAWLPSARAKGLADNVARSLGRGTVAVGALMTIVIAAVLTGKAAPALLAVTIVVTLAAAMYLRHRLGGVTGDTLGATSVVVETAVIAVALVWTRLQAPLEVLRWP
ncbi:MAG TPA: adenosylcobinamide-GDP ribazoletransferase [Thermoanaerobaculia bacterium]|jgi:adenosylcobinamide-GDP ribazoletransferase